MINLCTNQNTKTYSGATQHHKVTKKQKFKSEKYDVSLNKKLIKQEFDYQKL